MSGDIARRPHAILDLASRVHKALKIEHLLGLKAQVGADHIRLLEIGTGSGGIAHWFATQAGGRYEVDAVDVCDLRLVNDGYRFQCVQDTTLPFPSQCFDVVLSNHVIEHVGNAEAQTEHLREMRRVLTPCGVAYLAVPNRWMLFEPHYGLAFLSWWPERWRSTWLRLWRKGSHYDCCPLSKACLETMLLDAGWRFQHLHPEALTATLAIERPGSVAHQIAIGAPSWLWRITASLVPTLIYKMRPSNEEGEAGRIETDGQE